MLQDSRAGGTAAASISCPSASKFSRRGRPLGDTALAIRGAVLNLTSRHDRMTGRQAFYALEVQGVVHKTEGGYRQVQQQVLKLRREGLLPWSFITDGTRWQRKPDSYVGVEDYMAHMAGARTFVYTLYDRDAGGRRAPKACHENRWAGQLTAARVVPQPREAGAGLMARSAHRAVGPDGEVPYLGGVEVGRPAPTSTCPTRESGRSPGGFPGALCRRRQGRGPPSTSRQIGQESRGARASLMTNGRPPMMGLPDGRYGECMRTSTTACAVCAALVARCRYVHMPEIPPPGAEADHPLQR